MNDSLKIIPLGGLGEIGKNMTAVEYRGKIVVLDCGVEFPRDEMLGIDLVIPDIRWLLGRRDDVLAFVITHGHEDHHGALPFVLKQLNKPVYGSRFTLALIKSKLDEHGLLKVVELNEVSDKSKLRLGPFDVSFIATSHSVPDSLSIVLGTEFGRTAAHRRLQVRSHADRRSHHRCQRIRPARPEGRACPARRLDQRRDARVDGLRGHRGPGLPPDLRRGGGPRDRRELRLAHPPHPAGDHHRSSARTASSRVSGRSMVKNANIARNLGYLDVPDGAMIKLTEIDDYRPEEILILSTGSQGEPLSALTRMAFDDHPQVALHEGDTVVISAKAIPGNERSVMATIDRLLKVGATVIYGEGSGVHVSGHAAQEDLRMMLNLARPQYFVPVHGEYRMQHFHAELARQSGIRDEDIFILENGDVLELDRENGEIVDKVPTGMVFVDGYELGDADGLVLRDRQQLAGDGILIAVVTVDSQTGHSVAPPELVARGFLHDDDRLQEVLDECATALDDLMDELGAVHVTGQRLIRDDIKDKLAELVYSRTRRRPLIMPVVVEV